MASEMLRLTGLGVSPGVAIGRVVCIETRGPEVYRLQVAEEELEAEVARLHEGVRRARQELTRTRDAVSLDLGNELAGIFDAHALLLADPSFIGRAEEQIRSRKVNAEWAVARTAEELDDRFAHIGDLYLRERSEDLTDVSRHLLQSLQGIAHHDLSELPENVIIVADDLTPSDAIRLGRGRVIGFAIESGGRTSHTTIIARSLNLPAVAGVSGLVGLIDDEAPIILDGEAGAVILHPTAQVLAEYRGRQRDIARRDRALLATRELAAVTKDGVGIELMANIDLPEEVDEIRRFGAAGVGLYRSEFLYLEKTPDLPSEEEHLAIYRRLVERSAPFPAIIRTYDLGGRKLAREMMIASEEENPVLGLRGIRLTLSRPDVFRSQIRALYRAAVHGDLWIMLPLVSNVEEVRRFRALAAEVTAELAREGLAFRPDVRLGVMIEVPAAAVIADLLAREVDFFSIGTNDLIQYALAVDRNNDHVAELYQPFHPAILRMLKSVVDQARAAGIELSLCGEMAGDPKAALLLIGLGLRRLSMSPRRIAEIKSWLRERSVGELEELAAEALGRDTATGVQACLDNFLQQCALMPQLGPTLQ
jgi:phosphotransferase system enzyme I (PtsI)